MGHVAPLRVVEVLLARAKEDAHLATILARTPTPDLVHLVQQVHDAEEAIAR